jgi:gp45 sliding clamp, C terminal
MKFDAKTISILKNFSNISLSMIFREGNVVKVISPNKTIVAKAVVPVTFDRRFAVKNLSTFLNTLSFYEDPDVTFNEKNLTISKGESQTTMAYTAENTVKAPPENDPVLPSVDVSFDISAKALANITKMLGTLSLSEIAIIGDGTRLSVAAIDSKNSNSDTHVEVVGTTDKTFRSIFRAENLKIIPGDYHIDVCSRGISHFKGQEAEYWIVVEQNSTY